MSLAARIDRALAELPARGTLWIALSGGRDSVCLLHLAAQARQRQTFTLRALHVHHGLQAAADEFAAHCRRLCAALEVPLTLERITVAAASGISPEAAAREARYGAFARHVGRDDVLWLAHHRDDQAETLLLRLLRGAGVTGLGAMPAARSVGEGRLCRPLLEVGRDELCAYAAAHGLTWVDDPSNDELRFDRNYLRHRVMPLLGARWPAAAARLAASAGHARETAGLLDELAALDLERLGGDPARLPGAALLALSPSRQRLLIRYCLTRLGLGLPGERRLASLLAQLDARADSEVRVEWPGGEGRVWRGELHLLAPWAPLPLDWSRRWDGRALLVTPAGALPWRLAPADGAEQEVTVAPRQGGERLHRHGMRRRLKTLLQDAAVPPWERERLVVAWREGEAVAALSPGVALTADGWQATPRREPPLS